MSNPRMSNDEVSNVRTQYLMSNDKISNPRMFQNIMQAVLYCHLIIERTIKMKQYVVILRERLGSNSELVVDPMAVQFCARKVAAVHGDLRKALGVCRRAVELASQECSKAVHVSHIASDP